MSEPLDLDAIERLWRNTSSDPDNCVVVELIKELRKARERIYDLTKCWACDEGRDDETCTCTDERKGIISRLKERIKELEDANCQLFCQLFEKLPLDMETYDGE